MQKYGWLYLFIALVVQLVPAESAEAQLRFFPAVEKYTLGTDALNNEKKKQINMDLQGILLDGQKRSFPPDARTFDRSLIADARIGYNHPINAKTSVRFIAAALGIIRKEHTENEPRSVITEDGLVYRPILDFTFITASGIEVTVGAQYHFMPKYQGRTETPSVIANTEYSEFSVTQYRVAMIKRGGFGQGGFYYQPGVEASRDVKITFENVDEPIRQTREVNHFPTTIGIIMRFKSGKYDYLAEFQAVQAGEGGERKEDSNQTVKEDYNIIRLGMAGNAGTFDFDTSIRHKTLSYATSEDTRLDLVPITTLHLGLKAGSKTSFVHAGLVYSYAKDLQSEEEFNQEFRINGYGATAGFQLSL